MGIVRMVDLVVANGAPLAPPGVTAGTVGRPSNGYGAESGTVPVAQHQTNQSDTMRMISPRKTATIFTALLALLYSFPAHAAAPALTRIQLESWVHVVLLLALCVILSTDVVIRRLDEASRHVDANPADRNIVRTFVAIMLICVAVAWAALVATAVHKVNRSQPVHTLNEPLAVTTVTTMVALYWSFPISGLQRYRTLMIVGVLVVALFLAASLLTTYGLIALL
jgi:hypothetical protein